MWTAEILEWIAIVDMYLPSVNLCWCASALAATSGDSKKKWADKSKIKVMRIFINNLVINSNESAIKIYRSLGPDGNF